MNRLLILFFLVPCVVSAQQNTMLSESRVINDFLTKDVENINFQSPLVLSNMILFFYQGKAKSVELAGDFNNWSNNLQMEETRPNLWILSLKTRLPKDKYRYRIKVDGFWIADPVNPLYETDHGRQRLSILNLTNDFTPNKRYPFWVTNDTYVFQYQSTNANIVTIAGDFNNWNPYSHQLKHKGAGIFEIELELDPKKIHLYSFVQDGIWTTDPNNKKQFVNEVNRVINGFYADYDESIP